ncbi:MAG: ABC transporter ATP-binding protein [Bacillota bacterium]|nr:ABC transporter ATP-binding protein [Bacillota bacterium]
MLTSEVAPLLEIRELGLEFSRFSGKARVLDGVSLSVCKGEKVGVVGETGCGKSLTMKAVMGLLPTRRTTVTGGEILYKGQNLLGMNLSARRRITGKEVVMVFQDPNGSLNPVFTIGEQMEDILGWSSREPARRSLRFGLPKAVAAEARRRAAGVLAQVGLADPERILNSYPFQLSGGMRQRVLIAMALANQPELLIADEPGTALDVTTQAQILRLLDDLVRARGIAILMITHNLGVVRQVTDRVYVMYAGTVVETAPTERLFADPLHPYTQGLLASVPRLVGGGLSEGIDGSVPDYLSPLPGCRFAPRCARATERCHQEKPVPRVAGEAHLVACHLVK